MIDSSNLLESIGVEETSRAEVGEEIAVGRVELLAAVADPIRWRVLTLLSQKPHCVCDMQEHILIAANLLSYHLRVLRELGLVQSTKKGRQVEYRLDEGAQQRLIAALPIAPQGDN